MKRSTKRSIITYSFFILTLAMAVLFVACGGEEEPAEDVTLDEISIPTPTQRPTATPIPTNTPTPLPTNTPEASEEEIQATEAAVEELPDEFIEPEFVSINFRQGTINDWVEIQPPPGWVVSAGLDGMMISERPSEIPNRPFALVRRWGNVVTVSDWVAYLPDGLEERNSNVDIRMGGYDWEGVFISTEDHSYRAFFAVSNETLPAYTVLVYVPMTPEDLAEEETGYSRQSLLAKWDLQAGELNTILRRFLFS